MFCEEYIIDLNATKAAIRAGYSPRTAYSIANELLKKPDISVYIETLQAERSRRTGVTADRVINELAKVAFVKAADIIDEQTGGVTENASSEDKACIAGVKVKTVSGDDFTSVEREVKLYDKVKALELLGRHLGIFEERVKLEGCAAVKIVDDLK